MSTSSTSNTPVTSNASSLVTSTKKKQTKGCLKATILSAYDLPTRDPPPSHVTITVGRQSISTGPPIQRHKDHNSVKFSKKNDTCITIFEPLSSLYSATAVVQLVYSDAPALNLTAEYELKQLTVEETTWVILNLESATGSTTANTNKEDSSTISVPPTLRLQLTLQGPYRTEIAALFALGQSWFGMVDTLESNWKKLSSSFPTIPSLPSWKYLILPAVPILGIIVVALPLILGVMLVTLPMLLPLIVVVGTLFIALSSSVLILYYSTAAGRAQLAHACAPMAQTLLSTPVGQRLVYQTGPRPSPVNVARMVMPVGQWGKLMVSLVIDALGSASYLVPFVGEFTDLAWAPVQTVLIMALYNETSPGLKYISFVEELLPLTDIVPSATIGWLLEYAWPLEWRPLGGDMEELKEAIEAAKRAAAANNPLGRIDVNLKKATAEASKAE